jgi:hypothetical protein
MAVERATRPRYFADLMVAFIFDLSSLTYGNALGVAIVAQRDESDNAWPFRKPMS